jgi:hypothetical protein
VPRRSFSAGGSTGGAIGGLRQLPGFKYFARSKIATNIVIDERSADHAAANANLIVNIRDLNVDYRSFYAIANL